MNSDEFNGIQPKMSTTKPVGAGAIEIPAQCSVHFQQHFGLLKHCLRAFSLFFRIPQNGETNSIKEAEGARAGSCHGVLFPRPG